LTVPSTAAASIGRANWRQQRRQFSTRRFDNFKPVVFYQFHAAGDIKLHHEPADVIGLRRLRLRHKKSRGFLPFCLRRFSSIS
jgi:hypothetical protein